MRVIIGGVYQPFLDASQITITRAMTDPVPTCQLVLKDSTSAIAPLAMQEVIVIDEKVYLNPTINLFVNPSLNPYNGTWTNANTFTPVTGLTFSQNGGGGIIATLSNVATGHYALAEQIFVNSITAGQQYCFSGYLQASSPVGFGVNLKVGWLAASGAIISTPVQTGSVPPSTSLTRVSFSATAPAGTVYAAVLFELNVANATNSGSVTVTKPQFEPVWIPTLSYPTPWCGPSQTNCQQLPSGLYIRQYRKFAGFVNHVLYSNYHGDVRDVEVDCVGYAWLLSLILGNNSFSSQTDAAIISSLLSTYLPNMTTTTNVIAGATLSSVQLNWDDLRSTFDNLASQSGYYWTIDFYWNVIYAPPGYLSMLISLICDNSATPDMSTTYPAYNFSAETDYTQPGSVILVIGGTSGGTTYSAEVIDGSTIAQNTQISGYTFPSGSIFMRKVNESALLSNSDCTQRGMAELLQFDYPRYLYHLTTNVELIPGESIAITSATENLSASVQLIQQVTTKWLGTNETLTDEWEYQADLGAVNRTAIHILSRLFRNTNSNSSAPSIGTTTLAAFEKIGIVDGTAGTGSVTTTYATTVLADTPIAYYRLAEVTGTIADDISGHARQGTINNSPTLGVATLLTDPADGTDFAMTFANASSQDISLPTAFIPTGSGHAWSLECWCKPATIASGTYASMMSMGSNVANQLADIAFNNTGGTYKFVMATFGTSVFASTTITIGNIYHVVSTYDGTNMRLYVNSTLVAGPSAFSLNLTTGFAQIGNDNANFFNGTIDEPAFYNYALSSAQVSAHYTAGT